MPKSRFESLPTELRLRIYSLLLVTKPERCVLEPWRIGHSWPLPKLHPAILAVNRSISAETYPILYGENVFLFPASTEDQVTLDARLQGLSPLAWLPHLQKPNLLRGQTRHLIKHVAAATAAPSKPVEENWVDRFLESAPTAQKVEFDIWVVSYQDQPESCVTYSIVQTPTPAIEPLITASTQTFSIGIRDIVDSCNFRYKSKRVDLPSAQMAAVDLRSLNNMEEKRCEVRKAMQLFHEIMERRPPIPQSVFASGQALGCVEKRFSLHKEFAEIWSSDGATIQMKSQGWAPLDASGQIVGIGSKCTSITWRRSADHVKNKAL